MTGRDDPEARIADLERRIAQPRAAVGATRGPEPAAATAGPLTPEQVRSIVFAKPPLGKRGYNETEVDMFLDLVEAALRNPAAGIVSPEQIRTVAFAKPPLGKRGYNETAVDDFLDRVEEHLKSQQGTSSPPPQAGSPAPVAEPERRPAGPTRCVLIEVFNRRTLWRNRLRLDFHTSRPALTVDLGAGAIRVTDLHTNALLASAPLAQVTATPKLHEPFSDTMPCTVPVLVVGVPDLPRLIIGQLPMGVPPQWARRGNYASSTLPSWRNPVPTTIRHPTHVVTNEDWLALVEQFGLTAALDRRG